ncbi:MAG TPA: sulfur carrier protein ThiS [Bryobacteraceae bacterium]|jgi:thiamine biosynthesis protein ThiS|nr:sulfur carrier protein ThiS [Bryobacteraceae bacterium]
MSSGTIEIWINGESRTIAANRSVAELLASLELPADRIALELNKNIVRKRDWASVTVPAGARLEIVEFVGGG